MVFMVGLVCCTILLMLCMPMLLYGLCGRGMSMVSGWIGKSREGNHCRGYSIASISRRGKMAVHLQVRNLGAPVELAGRYFTEGADEVTFLNITGFRDFPLGDLPMLEVALYPSLWCLPPLS